MPTYLVFKKVHYADIKIFNSLPTSVTILKNDKAKFKAALGNTYIHTPVTLQMNFLCVKMIYSTVFVKWLLYLHCKLVYLCIYDLFHIQLCLWHTYGSMEWICIQVWKNSMPKLCEVIGGTKTKIYCQATVCRTYVLAVPWTIKVGLT